MDPNLFDVIFLFLLASSILGACFRGLGQETFHTLVFGLMLAAGYLVFQAPAGVQPPEVAVAWFKNTLYFVTTAYILSWAIMHSIGPVFVGHAHGPMEIRSRFWGGALNMLKVGAVIGGLSLWYAMHTPLPVTDRLAPLPKLVREGLVTAILDRNIDALGHMLVDNGVLKYPAPLEGYAPAPQPVAQPVVQPAMAPAAPEAQAPAAPAATGTGADINGYIEQSPAPVAPPVQGQ